MCRGLTQLAPKLCMVLVGNVQYDGMLQTPAGLQLKRELGIQAADRANLDVHDADASGGVQQSGDPESTHPDLVGNVGLGSVLDVVHARHSRGQDRLRRSLGQHALLPPALI